ncbi:MAG TPA: glycosyltransferase family 4 protein [Pseudomonadales bacterium]
MARRLKVASIFSNLIIGGDQNRLLSYLAARDPERFDHIVIGGMRASEEIEDLCGPIWDRFAALGVETVDLGMTTRYLRWENASRLTRAGDKVKTLGQLIQRTARILRERQIDIVDGRCDMGTVMATVAGRLAGVRAIVSTNYCPQHAGFRTPVWSLIGRGVYSRVDAIVSDSDACLEAMREWMISPPPGYCIPNGIEPARPARPPAEVAAQIGIPAGAKVVGQIARIQPYKGQDMLLRAAPLVLAEEPNAFFLVSGYPGYTKEALAYLERLHALVAGHGIGDRVRIISYPGEVGDLWSLIDVHAHPTKLDSSPIALLEGMSVGKPCVTTRIGGIHELVLDGETGIILDPENRDPALLASALLRLLKDPAEAARLGRNARRRYELGYTPKVMAERIDDMFDEVHTAPYRRRRRAA